MPSVYRTLAAWRHTVESVLTIGPHLSDAQWAAPTECPGWTVKDIYAHLVGGEQWVADGHPPLTEGIGPWADAAVRDRRGTPASAVLDELREVYELQRVRVESQPPDPDQPVTLIMGRPGTLGQLLRVRVMDLWVHEQDIRRAVGMPGNLDSPAAAVAGEIFVSALPRLVAKAAQAPAGSVFRLTTTREVTIDVAVGVGQDGQGTMVSLDRPATAGATLSWEAYTRLSCGRGTRADYDITVTGDQRLAERVLTNLSITP